MKKLIILSTAGILAGCGSFQLGHAHAPEGVTKTQMEQDMLVCKDQAFQAANTNERHAGAFLAGLTIIGAPIAIEAEKAKQREVWKECMERRGYRVTPPANT